jgi:uncharacterized protein YkwD
MTSYFTESPKMGENIEFGSQVFGYNAQAVLISLIIDDGVPSRSHRLRIFDSEMAQVGVSCGEHSVYGSMCTLDYGGAAAKTE